MAQRIAVLLAVASILVLSCAADGMASAQKYDKSKHSYEKHDKEYKPDYKNKHSSYDKDYKPESHKEYKPDGYKPDYPKPGYFAKEYEHYLQAPYGGEPTYGGRYYQPPQGYEGYAHPSYGGYEGYSEPSPYDGGYWGGVNGRQVIHLQAIYAEDLLNTTLVDPAARRSTEPQFPCTPETIGACVADFGLICAWRHHERDHSYGSDYASGKYAPIFQTEPTTPVAVGKGWSGFEFQSPPLRGIDLVTFNNHQIGYQVGNINGFLTFAEGAQNCHPLLGPNTKVNFYEHNVPTYLIFGKVRLPVDPAILVPLGGLGFGGGEGEKTRRTKTQSVDTSDYKTTPEGTKYKIDKEMAYVYNEKDDTLCGLSLVARGAVSLVVDPTGTDNDATYTGTMQWPLVWTDLVTTLPLLVQDNVDQPARRDSINIDDSFNFNTIITTYINVDLVFVNNGGGGGLLEAFLGRLLDRVGSICKANSDIPWITPGAITLDVSRTA